MNAPTDAAPGIDSALTQQLVPIIASAAIAK